MLFVISMEVLNALILRADTDGLLTPIGHSAITFRASFYADDMVIFIKPLRQDMLLLLAILDVFEKASGLKANRAKSRAISLNCAEQDFQMALTLFGCAEESFPCRYLGIPLSIRRLCQQPLIDAVSNRIPAWKGNLLNLAGRSTLVASTL